jgi:signal transduction histidine kinase
MVVQAGAGLQTLPPGADSSRASLEAIQSSGRQALRELRRLLGVLRDAELSPTLGPQPGLEDVKSLVEQARSAGTPVDVSVVGVAPSLPAGLDLAAFRIVQEALTNVLKHAPGRSTNVLIGYRFDGLELEVVNEADSAPFNRRGHGIVGMRERAMLYGGTLEAGPASGCFRVNARLPIEPIA